jgi:hypothetical protein
MLQIQAAWMLFLRAFTESRIFKCFALSTAVDPISEEQTTDRGTPSESNKLGTKYAD